MSTTKYTRELLIDYLSKTNAIIIGEYAKIYSITRIMFVCSCGNNSSRIVSSIIKNIDGIYCKKCTHKLFTCDKMKKTNLERYGTENPMKNDKIKEKLKASIIEKYGVENVSQNNIIKEKKKETSMKNYGSEYAMQNIEHRAKVKTTILEKYNVEYYLQSNDKKEKSKKTCIERYNVEYPIQNVDVRTKAINTLLFNYGVQNPSQSKEIQDKKIETSLQKYGVENPMQNKDIQQRSEKNSKRLKDYIMPSGEIRKVQGYEPFALDILITQYTEEQIINSRKDVPRIKYKNNYKNKYYFPDIFIPHENKIIEVKSKWSNNLHLEMNRLKKDACITQGYLYELWCFDSKGNKIDL